LTFSVMKPSRSRRKRVRDMSTAVSSVAISMRSGATPLLPLAFDVDNHFRSCRCSSFPSCLPAYPTQSWQHHRITPTFTSTHAHTRLLPPSILLAL
jgi:hypothetical protein